MNTTARISSMDEFTIILKLSVLKTGKILERNASERIIIYPKNRNSIATLHTSHIFHLACPGERDRISNVPASIMGKIIISMIKPNSAMPNMRNETKPNIIARFTFLESSLSISCFLIS